MFEHGIPEKVLTDQGTNFTSELFKNTCKLLKIEKIQTTAYHPESNAAISYRVEGLSIIALTKEVIVVESLTLGPRITADNTPVWAGSFNLPAKAWKTGL